MPCVRIDYSEAQKSLLGEAPSADDEAAGKVPDNVVTTPRGRMIIEIQGELKVPSKLPETYEEQSSDNGIAKFVKVDDIYDAVRFGRLELDLASGTRAKLFVGKSQMLTGTVEDLETPLGILCIPRNNDQGGSESTIGLVDVIKKKIIFRDRPVPTTEN